MYTWSSMSPNRGSSDIGISPSHIPAGLSDRRGPGGTATLEPVNIPLILLDGPKEAYIEILHRPDHILVAVLELLSPANKEQPGRTEYLAKRRAILNQHVHLIELDLLLGGRRLPLQASLPAGDFYYLLSRADGRPDCQVFAWRLRDPLPTLPVPLRAPDPDVMINLGDVFVTAYERGRYRRKIDYAGELPHGLSEADREWARQVVQTG